MPDRMPKVVLALLAGLIALALGSGAQAQAPKGLAGTWKLNAAKSKFSPGPAPKSMTVTYTPAGDSIKIVVDVTPPEGPAQHWEMTGNYDGKEYPVTGNPNADMASFKLVNDRTGVSTFKKDGKVTATNRRVLSADGKTLTITSKGRTADGKARNDLQVFEK
ncbi:MAG: hypothetical protein DMF84_14150 [Acidobacteria bacterium]|nr:MAG: hypothetical protein DMF84_14150 [Acidobacteriota bacterium]